MADIDYVSVAEAAKVLGISRQRVQELVQETKLAAIRLPGSQTWLIRRSDLLRRVREMQLYRRSKKK